MPSHHNDRRVIRGIIYVILNGLQRKDAPPSYGPHKTLYNRFVRWSRRGVFERIFAALAGQTGAPDRLMIDTTHLKAHYTAASLRQEGAAPGRSLVLLLTEGQMNDHKGAALILPALPAKDLIADRGYDSNRFRTALVKREITPRSHRRGVEKSKYHTTRPCIESGIVSRIPSAG